MSSRKNSPEKRSLAASLFRLSAKSVLLLMWSAWMFLLGVMASKGMIPSYFRMDNVLSSMMGSEPEEAATVQAPAWEQDARPEFRLDVFEDLAGSPDGSENVPRAPKRYTVQVASVRSQEDADRFIARLKLLGIAADAHPIRNGNVTWYAIRSGQFTSLGEAQTFATQLQGRTKFDPLVLQLSR